LEKLSTLSWHSPVEWQLIRSAVVDAPGRMLRIDWLPAIQQ
jgi:hypothetical protein